MFDELSDLDPAGLVGVVESVYRQESVLVARRLAAVAGLLGHRLVAAAEAEERGGYAQVDPFQQTAAEVAAAMNLAPMAAGYVVSDAEALDVRLPKVAALLAEGKTDWRTVQLIIRRTELVSDQVLRARLDESLSARIAHWQGWSRRRVLNAVDAAVRAIDPDGTRERRRAAEQERRIGISALDNGMAQVSGTVAAAAATAFDRRLSQLATQVCAGDPRTMDQRRADALGALAAGRSLACACGQAECPSRAGADGEADRGGVRVVINVVATDATVRGDSDRPGYLQGYGVIDGEQVRALAAAAASLPVVVDPVTSAAAALRYQPSAALERAVRCRDLTCRFPGCGRPAAFCDLDHTIPFNHADPGAGGRTVFTNLKCLCRLHHRLKTFGGWRDVQLADATVVWTSPAGRTYRTSAAGADLFPPPRAPVCAAPTPRRGSRSRRRSARIAAARGRNREQRPLNEARRRLEEARKQEIADRKWRNEMRDMLVLFKGGPSASPFSTWINDPREPEELPPDWEPDLPAREPVPDDPPF
jgi:Domain of unknown function (DUF222)